MKHLKLFFALFAMLALGVGNAWGAEVTFTANTDKGTTQNTSADSMTKDGITISSTSAGLAYAEYRFYNGTITISTDVGNITNIKFTCTSPAYATTLGESTTSAGSLSTSGSTVTWEGSSSSFTIRNTAQTRASEIVVTYEAVAQSYDVVLDRNSVQETINDVASGTSLDDIDGDGEQGGCEEWSFVGWSKSQRSSQDDGTPMNLVTKVDNAGPYYAVYSHAAAGGGSSTTKTMDSFTSKSGNIDGDANVSYAAAQGTASTAPALNDNEIRIYQNGGTLTITANNGNKLTSITIGSSMKTSVSYKIDEGTESADQSITADGKYTLSDIDATSVLFTCKGTDKYSRLYLNYLSVTYLGGGTIYYTTTPDCGATSDVIVKTLKSIAVTGMKQEFVEGDEFTFGGTCTATYSVTKNDVPQDNETKTVTPTVSAPNMTQIGEQTVTVSYTDGEVTAETSYTINITEKPKHTITWNNAGTTNTTEVVQGEAFGTLPKPADCDNGKKFMGWTAVTSVNNDGSGIVYVKETDIPTSDMTYYAVFAVEKVGEGEVGSADVTLSGGNFADSKITWDSDYATIVQEKVSGSTAVNSSYVASPRWYVGHKVTITPKTTINITAITIDQGTGDYAKFDQVTATNASIAIDGQTVTITPLNGTEAVVLSFGKQVRPISINIAKGPATTYSDYSLNCDISVEPTWTISKNEIAFADKYVGFEYTETFTINASNLAEDIALAIDGSTFTVSPTSIAKDATFPQTVTVTYAPTAVGTHNATLNITSGSTLSKAIALTGSATEATIYTLTALADINPTDKVIIVGTSGGNTYAMSNDKGASDAPDAITVTVIDNKIATDKTNILWNIAKDGDNLTIYPADQTAKWLYCLADENDGVRVGTGNAKEFTIDKGYLYTTQTTYARHIGIYNNSDWRCYKPSGDAIANNIKDQSFAFYVLPNTDPSISVTPASKDFGVLTVNETATQEIEITALNITQELTAEITGDGFTKSEIVDNKITITFAPTEVKEYSATLTISAGTEASASVTLAGEGVGAAYSVTYNKNGAEGNAPTDETKYVAGSKVTVAGQGDMTMAGYRFAGWKYGDEIYKAGAKFTMPAEDVTFMAQWVEKEDFSTGYWVLVNDASELDADNYVIIAAADYNVAMKSYETGNNCKQVDVLKEDNLLTWNENVGVFQLAKSGDIYTFQDVNTEQYLYAAGGTSSNYLRAADEIPADENAKKYSWTISVADNKATIKAQIEDDADKKAHNWLRYNNTESGKLFSCYDVTSSQKDIALYKYVTELPTPTPDYTRPVTAGKLGTLCLPFGGTITGAVLYECVGKEEGKVYLGSVTELEAGVPYIFQATATELAVYSDGTTAPAGNHNGLYGTFDNETVVAAGDYILLNNELRPSDGTAKVKDYRAYLVMGEVPVGAPQQMPGRKYIGMSVQGENGETGFENITAPAGKTVKAIVNGQLIIIRDGVKYNAQGQRL